MEMKKVARIRNWGKKFRGRNRVGKRGVGGEGGFLIAKKVTGGGFPKLLWVVLP